MKKYYVNVIGAIGSFLGLIAITKWPIERCIDYDPSGSCDNPDFKFGPLVFFIGIALGVVFIISVVRLFRSKAKGKSQ